MYGIIPRTTKKIGYLKMWTLKTMCFILVFLSLSVIAQNTVYFFIWCVSKFILKILHQWQINIYIVIIHFCRNEEFHRDKHLFHKQNGIKTFFILQI